jgi:hypothetical protein
MPHRLFVPLLCALLCVAVGAGVGEGQGGPSFAVLRDSLNQVTDASALRRRADATGRAGAEELVARGLVGLRLYVLTADAEAAKRARRAFEEAGRTEPRNAWAWYGLGLSWAEGPEAGAPVPAVVVLEAFEDALRLDPRSRALRAFQRALEVDSTFTPAAVALVPLALEKRSTDALRLARTTLALAEREGRFETDALLALAQAQAALGEPDAAVDAARRAANGAVAGDAWTRHALARALFSAGDDEEGARAWFEAVDALTPALADACFEELRPIAEDWEQERWAGADLEARQAWLRRFWEERAALGGVSVAQRLGNHYRRLERATQDYARRRKWGARPINALLLERPDLPFDDRGIIYVRHGPPVDVIRTPGDRREPGASNFSESWIYRSPEGGFTVLHFIEYDSEYVLAWNLPCGEWAQDRALYDRRLALMRCNEFDQRAISAEVRRDARTALRTDSDRPEFARDLPFAFDTYTFRGNAGVTDVTAALLVRAREIAAEPAFDGVAYGIDVSLILADTLFGRINRADTSLTVRSPRLLRDDEWLRAQLTLASAPATAAAQRVLVRERAVPAHGQLLGRTLDVPDYSGEALQLSDIVLAEPDSGGAFRRGEVALALVPTREFPGGAFRAFYEVYNLSPDAAAITELVVERRRDGLGRAVRRLFGSGPVVRLRFQSPGPATGGVLQEVRRIDTALGPGAYRIRVRITDALTGQTAEQQREFTVVR